MTPRSVLFDFNDAFSRLDELLPYVDKLLAS
jgi:hypothetical protein